MFYLTGHLLRFFWARTSYWKGMVEKLIASWPVRSQKKETESDANPNKPFEGKTQWCNILFLNPTPKGFTTSQQHQRLAAAMLFIKSAPPPWPRHWGLVWASSTTLEDLACLCLCLLVTIRRTTPFITFIPHIRPWTLCHNNERSKSSQTFSTWTFEGHSW